MVAAVVEWLTGHTGVVEEVRLIGFDAGTAQDFAEGLKATGAPA